jgi:hypothetical protein
VRVWVKCVSVSRLCFYWYLFFHRLRVDIRLVLPLLVYLLDEKLRLVLENGQKLVADL